MSSGEDDKSKDVHAGVVEGGTVPPEIQDVVPLAEIAKATEIAKPTEIEKAAQIAKAAAGLWLGPYKPLLELTQRLISYLWKYNKYLLPFLGLIVAYISYLYSTTPIDLHPTDFLEKYLPQKSDDRVIDVISWNPRAFVRHNFLTDTECAHLITLAKSGSGNRPIISKDDIVSHIEDKIAKWTFLPVENGEPMKVVRYDTREKEQAQRDYSFVTVVMYLNNVDSGGKTVVVKNAMKKQGHVIKHDPPGVECSEKGYSVKPRRGTALLIFNLNASVAQEAISTRRDCPVIMGEKWTAVKLVHVGSFNSVDDCKDMNDQCIRWAELGQCTENAGYMLNACRKSCKEC